MILPILRYPDKRLKTIASPVESVDDGIRDLIKDMFETMYSSKGIGLAATQINQHIRLIVIDISEDKSQPLCFINPEIIAKDGEIKWMESCLSIPNYTESVTRKNHIKVKAINEKGQEFELEATALLGVCIQHEIDHLDGILFIDYLSKFKQRRLLEKSKKEKNKST
jgi:peptide deformylase